MTTSFMAFIKAYWKAIALVVIVVIIAAPYIMLANSSADLAAMQSDNNVLRNDNNLQSQVIATQAFNFSRFNQVADNTNRLNSLIDAGTDKTVIEYREILKREKTCDLPVPADVAGGLLEYAYRLRASALHANSGRPDTTDDSSVASGSMTYCQAVLWIKPLLAAIEKGNNNFAAIREIEKTRASQ